MTGGGNGIGKSIAFRLAKEGCKIAIVDIDETAAIQTADEVKRLNVDCQAYCVSANLFRAMSSFFLIEYIKMRSNRLMSLTLKPFKICANKSKLIWVPLILLSIMLD